MRACRAEEVDADGGGRRQDRNFYLIPTAEVPVTNMVRDVVLTENDLPLRMTGSRLAMSLGGPMAID